MFLKRIINYLKYKQFVAEEVSFVSNDFEFKRRSDQLTRLALTSQERGVSDANYCKEEIIVSLTTYGERIHDVYLSIESIMQGSIKPNRIILNIDKKFKDQHIPQTLQNQQKRGLEINYCEDIRSYTKLIPTLQKYPEAAIITIDDDLIYHFDLVENLVFDYIKEPDCIHACRVHRIVLGNDKKPVRYTNWQRGYHEYDASFLNFLTGVGGVIYPPHCFDSEVFNSAVFLDICKYADDVWFWAMSMKNGTKTKKTFTRSEVGEDYLLNEKWQDTGLKVYNDSALFCRNDEQIKAVCEKYNLWDKLK